MTKGIRYKNDYLTEVIFKINFSNILKLSGNKKEAAEEFQKEIFEEFPNVEFQYNNNVNVQLDIKKGKSQTTIDDGDLTWIFSDETNLKHVELNSNTLVLVYHKSAYEGFKEFLTDVSLLLNALRWYAPFNILFLGLRYINRIPEDVIDDNNIHEYINKSLISDIIFDLDDDEGVSQLFSRLDLLNEDYQLTFQYGFFNPDYPNPYSKKGFILDFDCKWRKIDSVNSQVAIEESLKRMNKIIYKKFEYSITDKLKELMDVVE